MELVRVIERCRIPLSIGKYYQDEVICDVIHMDICHLLSDRLWQFNVDATLCGQATIYKFVKDDKKITLILRK